MENWGLYVFLLWPLVVVAAAGVNMLISWSFSWSELIFDFLVGVTIGACVVVGTGESAGGFAHFLLVMSTGFWGLLHVAGVESFTPTVIFWTTAVTTIAATAITAGLDRLAIARGDHLKSGSIALSVVIGLLKAPHSLVTSGVGLLFFLVGIVRSLFGGSRVGHLGGVFFVEWNNSTRTIDSATTLGWTVQVWHGQYGDLMDHELYHTRQYIYLHDWLVPAWLLGGIWGLVASAISGDFQVSCFSAASRKREIGNPIERAAYQIGGGRMCQ